MLKRERQETYDFVIQKISGYEGKVIENIFTKVSENKCLCICFNFRTFQTFDISFLGQLP